MGGPAKPRIVAAMPCWNTAATVATVVKEAKKYVDQVVVIDDGSTDDTKMKAASAGALVVSHPVNKGYGEASRGAGPQGHG